MCCMNFKKNIIPFFITFSIGILAAGFVYSLIGSSSANNSQSETFEKNYKYQPTSCWSERRTERHHEVDVLEMVPAVPIAPPLPPAPSVAPEDINIDNNFDIWISEPNTHNHRRR